MSFNRVITAFAVVVILETISHVSRADVASDYREKVHPILEKYCYDCHNEKKLKGDLNLSLYGTGQQFVDATDLRRELLERIQSFEMPPKGSPEIDYTSRETLLGWLRGLPKANEIECNEIASD